MIGIMQLLQPFPPKVKGAPELAARCQAEGRGAIILATHHQELLTAAVLSRLPDMDCRPMIGGKSLYNFLTSHNRIPAGFRHPTWEVDPRHAYFSTVTQQKQAITFLRHGGLLAVYPDSEVPPSKRQTAVISLFGIRRRISCFAFRLALKERVAVYCFSRRWRADNSGYDYALDPLPPFATVEQGAALFERWINNDLVGQEHDYSAWWWLSQRYADHDRHPLPHRELDESYFAIGEFAPPQN
jgi:lauroyl/myristoyl acyltransferase